MGKIEYNKNALTWLKEHVQTLNTNISELMTLVSDECPQHMEHIPLFLLDPERGKVNLEDYVQDITSHGYFKLDGIDNFNKHNGVNSVEYLTIQACSVLNMDNKLTELLTKYGEWSVMLNVWKYDPSMPVLGVNPMYVDTDRSYLFSDGWEERKDLYTTVTSLDSKVPCKHLSTPVNSVDLRKLENDPGSIVYPDYTPYTRAMKVENLYNMLPDDVRPLIPTTVVLPRDVMAKYAGIID